MAAHCVRRYTPYLIIVCTSKLQQQLFSIRKNLFLLFSSKNYNVFNNLMKNSSKATREIAVSKKEEVSFCLLIGDGNTSAAISIR